MKMLLELLKPTAGEIQLFGQQLTTSNRALLLRRIGSMIEAPSGYGHLTGWENMRIVQKMLKLERARPRKSGHVSRVVLI